MIDYRQQMFRSLTGGRNLPSVGGSAYRDSTDQDNDQGALDLLRNGVRIAKGEDEGDDDTRDPFTDLGDIGVAARRLFANHRAAGQPMNVDADSAALAKFILAVHRKARPGEAAS